MSTSILDLPLVVSDLREPEAKVVYMILAHITNSLGFNIGSLPFLCLGVPIFKGKPKAAYFQPVVDKIKVNYIKELEKCMRNFLWSGDLNNRKLATVS
ncbi:hypothetical protein MTR_2g081130 [Medicago truncatula]|uniref:Uncharacterized protein n=1 Tax=Medicago truncatula TaxID=3880 RepID=G7IR64_MEDTR|nr:hypothetical protein MTR_2g081130 [Medicago truncatula]